jgi:hypothetical protein
VQQAGIYVTSLREERASIVFLILREAKLRRVAK